MGLPRDCVLEASERRRKKILEYLKKGLPPKAARPLTDAQVRDHLLPAILKGPLGELVSALYKYAPDPFTKPMKDLGLKKKEQIDVKSSQLFFVNIYKYVAGALSGPPLDVYQRSGSMAELELANSRPPALVAGESSAFFKDIPQRLLAFHIARNVLYARPELFLARIFHADGLRDLLAGFIGLYNQKALVLGSPGEVQTWAQTFTELPEAVVKRVKDLTIPAYGELKTPNAVQQSAEAADLAALRAGLLMAGDLEAAVRGAGDAVEGVTRMSSQQKAKELMMFAVSEDHFALREHLGLAIKG